MSLLNSPANADKSTEKCVPTNPSGEIEITLPVSLLQTISQIAVAKGMTLEGAINDAIAHYLEKQKGWRIASVIVWRLIVRVERLMLVIQRQA